MIVIDGVELGRCVTVREVMQRFGISKLTARKRLRRLERRGLVERRHVGRVVLYCVREGVQAAVSPPPSRPLGPGPKTRRRMEEVLDAVVREGCVTTSLLIRKYGISHTQAFHTLRLLQGEGRVVEVVVGNTALWCRDRAAAEELIRRLRDAVHRLAVSNSFRYATPAKVLRAVQSDKDAYALFSRFIPLSRFADDHIRPVALAFADSILRSLYGDPVRYAAHRHVYFVSPHPRQELDITIKDGTSHIFVNVRLPPDLADALEDAERRGASAEEIVKQAIEQLLARYR